MKDKLELILNNPTRLSESQEKAVISGSRNVKIVAGAGAGKTETITRRILFLLLQKNVDPASIVAFTFTEKAAEAMKSRIYRRVEGSGEKELLRKLGTMYVGTIHGYYLKILQENYGYGDYSVLDENQEMAFVLRHGYEIGLNRSEYTGIYSSKCEMFLDTNSVVYGELIDRTKLEALEPNYFKSLTKYEAKLHRYRRLTFDYMSYLAITEINKNPSVLEVIKYLIVDEFQDINSSQFQLIKSIGNKASVFVVGDPRQSIYQWRGSNDKFFLDFSTDFPEVEEIQISENRRSGNEIVKISNEIADKFVGFRYDHMIGTRVSRGQCFSTISESDEKEAVDLADKFEWLHREGVDFSEIGVLFRSVNTSATHLIDELKKRRIPYVIGGKIGLFRRDEAQALGRILSWIPDGGFWLKSRFNWGNKITGDKLLETGLKYWKDAVTFDLVPDIKEKLELWKQNVIEGGYNDYKDILSQLLVILGYKKLDHSDPYEVALMANIGRFSSLMGDFEIANRFGGKPKKLNMNSEMKSFCWFLNTYATKAYEEQAPEDLTNVDAISIMTIHQAKGLEWPFVFVPSVVDRRFPSSMMGKERKWMIDSSRFEPDFDSSRYKGNLEDEKRLFYVAATRARDSLVISRFASMNGNSRSSSILLEDLNLNDIENSKLQLNMDEIEHAEADENVATFSAKDVIDYRRCPFHYRLSSQWNYFQGVSPFMGYGETLHFCLRSASELIKRRGLDPETAIREAFDSEFFLPFASENLVSNLKETVRSQLINYVSKRTDDMINISEVETRIEFPVENASITGKVDVIIRDGSSYEVRDYKTSDKVITKEDSELQVRLYSLGLSYLGKKISKGSIATLDNALVKDVGVTEAEKEIARQESVEMIKNIKNRKFKGKPGSFCQKCEFNQICKWSKT